MMRITTKTDTSLVAKSGPRYILIGAFGLFVLSISILAITDGSYRYALFGILASIFILSLVRWYRLTINKQTGVLSVSSWTMVRPWPTTKSVPIKEIDSVWYDSITPGPGQLASIKFGYNYLKQVRFGMATPHYYRPFIDQFNSKARYREQDIALEIAQYLGVEHYDC